MDAVDTVNHPAALPVDDLPVASAVTYPREEVLHTMAELREFLREYADLVEASLDGRPLTEKLLARLEEHRSRVGQPGGPQAKMGEMVALMQGLLEGIHRDSLHFRVPTRSGLLPEVENPDLRDISSTFKTLNVPLERLTALLQHSRMQTEEDSRLHFLLAAISALLKGVVRQDWPDVNLVLSHINLITTSSKNQKLVQQMAQIARDIYNSLNEFSEDLSLGDLSNTANEIPDAVVKLHAVIDQLEKYANASLDELEQLMAETQQGMKLVEAARDSVEQTDQELDALAQSQPALASELADLRGTLREGLHAPLQELHAKVANANEQHMALISNMSYQDLTGQTLKKVIAFIEQLQAHLMGLISKHRVDMPAVQREEPEAVPTHGPDLTGRTTTLSQDNVDKMLAQLGF